MRGIMFQTISSVHSHSFFLLNVDVLFISASDYPTVGEAIRSFEYSRWGLVYVVLINAQQS